MLFNVYTHNKYLGIMCCINKRSITSFGLVPPYVFVGRLELFFFCLNCLVLFDILNLYCESQKILEIIKAVKR